MAAVIVWSTKSLFHNPARVCDRFCIPCEEFLLEVFLSALGRGDDFQRAAPGSLLELSSSAFFWSSSLGSSSSPGSTKSWD